MSVAFPSPPLRLSSLALFGGTFDPVHCGHLAAAQEARKRFGLEAVHFVVAGCPPHKRRGPLASYAHRCAMAALACANQPGLVVSFAEAGADFSGRRTFYSADLVGEHRKRLPRRAHLYFLIGVDAFLTIGTWHEPEALLESCDFLVVSRPGFRLDELRRALPPGVLPSRGTPRGTQPRPPRGPAPQALRLRRSTVHLISSVHVDISSTEIRRRAARGASIRGMVPPAVEDYICKQALYR
ncbi:MAG TPA: nicotinate (nicotinamide) nucleotide adenylyltransferase [Candidatus Binatia bacterium]|nr:nicotinate (nicotinamide) nucleotide adenylyltransferase [Candidatus Binatia bacterium]